MALLTMLSAVPAAAEPAGADLAVTVAFDKPAYLAYERMTATVTVVNNGTAPATGVTLSHESNGPFDPKEWFGLDPSGPGVTIEPGQQVAASATIEMQDVVDVLRLAVEVHTPTQETDTTNNAATAEAPVTVRRTDLNGTLYRDIDGDKQFDPGEALGGVLLEGVGGRPLGHVSVRTDGAGRFTAPNVAEGTYVLTPNLPAGWWHDETSTVEVRVGGPEPFIRAVRDSSALRSSITFDRAAYAVGDTIRETVTLTNTGSADLAGVTARCNEGAAPNELSGLGWGDLVHDLAPGVTVRAGETRTFQFTDVVPDGGRLYGFISITCWFGTAFRYDDGPKIVARADVPGGRGSSGGVLFFDRNDNGGPDAGETVSGVKVFLVDRAGKVAARDVSDADGTFMFRDVPANRYFMRLAGPWQLVYEGLEVTVFDGDVTKGIGYAVSPGPNQPDLDAPPLSIVDVKPVPTPQASPPRPAGLADTGADVVELTVFGILLLLAGGGLLLVRRSREVP
ncbi:SdrD B-like domain-containing protein [Actinophytocola sp.]|uniref:SdrD B-like domain-containing protein n=1 Tax=Actinophytocola sp. TaxID=1872138 RepID=UPI002D4920A0|nr:SdrD B-like domain-containing protein [Actinophytocola sp.]HYQ61975.1 SdrD B-like domain-containing protein [Actinophytocola sp.]